MIFDVSKRLPADYRVAANKAQAWLINLSESAIKNHEQFTHTMKTSAEVAKYVVERSRLDSQSSSPECELRLLSVPWYKRASYRNTIAVHSRGSISFNPKFLKRDMPDIINTIVHEYMHFIGYSHDGNKPTAYNLKSVPYSVGALAEAYFRQS